MSNYIKQPRLIFRDTIQKNLIGPGSDVFLSNAEEEIISDYPLSRYFSSILFPEKEIDKKNDSIGLENDTNAIAETIDNVGEELVENQDPNIEVQNDIEVTENVQKKESEPEYSDANQYFPTNFGLTFCVPKETESINVTFSFAKYKQIKPTDAKIEIDENDFEKFFENPYNPIKEYLTYENGFMSLQKAVFDKGNLDVRSYADKFKVSDQQKELIDTIAYKKVELLLGRLWQRVKQDPIIVDLDLTKPESDDSKEYSLKEDSDNNKILTCYYKKVYETDYGKFIKILMANRETHPKKKFSFGNEVLNSKSIFQGEISIKGTNFLPYKQLSETNPFDEELNLINFQYRNEKSFGIGHGCAIIWNNDNNPTELKTTFLPEVDIKNYSNEFKDDFPDHLKDITELRKLSIWTKLEKDVVINKLRLFAFEYQKWILIQEKSQAIANYQESLNLIRVCL